jgi:hypothetical protein
MPQYKCVPAPQNIVIESKSSMDDAVRKFADLINAEATNGWAYHSQQDLAVTQKAGCLAGIFGAKDTQLIYKMLVFVKN